MRSNLRSGTLLALRELRRAKVRFGLLTAAVAFLSFLIVSQQALLQQLVDEVAGVAGVATAGPLGVGAFTVAADGEELTDATVFGYTLGRPGPPRVLSSGQLPDGPGKACSPMW